MTAVPCMRLTNHRELCICSGCHEATSHVGFRAWLKQRRISKGQVEDTQTQWCQECQEAKRRQAVIACFACRMQLCRECPLWHQCPAMRRVPRASGHRDWPAAVWMAAGYLVRVAPIGRGAEFCDGCADPQEECCCKD